MGAMYYMGTREGKSKTTGNPYWAVMLFRFNRFSNWEVTQSFVDRDMFDYVNSLRIPTGQPVTATVDIDGQISDLMVDQTFELLNLNCRTNANGKGV